MSKTIFDIDELIANTVNKTVFELKKANLMKDNKKTAYQKTEQLLYNYNDFKKAVQDKLEKIDDIKKYGIPKKSGSIIGNPDTIGYREQKTEEDKKKEKIVDIEMTIETTEKFIAIIDEALHMISNDTYYEIISMQYFKNETRSAMAAYFDVDERTITRNKTRLVNKLKIYLFSDEAIKELFM